MKYYLIAGERSGDHHGAQLIRAIRQCDHRAGFRGVGGELMVKQGMECHFNTARTSWMGFREVLLKGFEFYRLLKSTRSDILDFSPDTIILIDFAGFNLRIARFARKHGKRVIYFIPPKVWAWGHWRTKFLKKFVNEIVVLYPFEKEYMSKHGITAHYYGNPLTEEINSAPGNGTKGKFIALLPGSRTQEIKACLPVMLTLARHFPDEHFIICALPVLGKEVYSQYSLPANVDVSYSGINPVLSEAKAAVTVSGTATMECCLFKVPQVVVYRSHWLNYLLARMLINVRFISLVNIIAGKEVVKELIQYRLNVPNLVEQVNDLLVNHQLKDRIITEYEKISCQLQGKDVYLKVGRLIVNMI